jgi:RNA polymerase sigma-B factor
MPALRAGRTSHATDPTTAEVTAQPTATCHRWRNREQLHALQAAADPHQRLKLRNTLVAANLGLVFGLARSLGHSHRLDHEDLTQVASIGLIRAVEAYDPCRGTALSTFALPYIRGAILHELRDRRHLVRVPRDLWELRQQVNRLQEQRRRSGRPPLAPAELTERLGCGSERLRDLEELALREAPCSLDAPAAGSAASQDGRPAPLLEQLPAPAPPSPLEPEDRDADPPELTWLRSQLAQLDPAARDLLLGRLQLGCTWVELGERLGLAPRQAQRRCTALQQRLQAAASEWLQQAQAGRSSAGSSSG